MRSWRMIEQWLILLLCSEVSHRLLLRTWLRTTTDWITDEEMRVCGSDWNGLTTIVYTAMTFGTDAHVPHRMYCNNSGDHLVIITFSIKETGKLLFDVDTKDINKMFTDKVFHLF